MKVSYNNVVLERAQTTQWDETLVYDEAGLNLLGTKITLSWRGLILPAGYIGDVNATLPAGATTFRQRVNLALRNLEIPRGALIVKDDVDGSVFFEAYPDDATGLSERQARNCDVAGGPKPVSARVETIVNQCAIVSWTVEVQKIRCLGGDVDGTQLVELGENPQNGFVVSHRCWTNENIDQHFYTTREITGRVRISSTQKSVHFYRNIFYPPLEEGFCRTSVRFSESEDGLTLNYSVTDKQIRQAAPWPATAMQGNVSWSITNGAQIGMRMQLTMIGRPDCNKKALTSRALQAVVKKIESFKNAGANGYQTAFEVAENIGDPPSVSVNVSYQLYATTSESDPSASSSTTGELAQLYAAQIGLFGDPLQFDDFTDGSVIYTYNRVKSATPNPYGYDVFEAYQDETKAMTQDASRAPTSYDAKLTFIKSLASAPCRVANPILASGELQAEELDGLTRTKVIQDQVGTTYATKPSGATQEAVEYPASFYKSDITYSTEYARFVLPKAAEVEEEPAPEPEPEPDPTQQTQDPPTPPVLTPEEEEEQEEAKWSARVVDLARPYATARVTIEAERFGRLPSLPNPEEVVTTTGDDPVKFKFLRCKTKIADPRPARNNDAGISYSVAATYEYAMSRPWKKDDEIWLLQNPTFGAARYYPKIPNPNPQIAEKIDDVNALKRLYDGEQLSHGTQEEPEPEPNPAQQ